jgi:hypothetical protein
LLVARLLVLLSCLVSCNRWSSLLVYDRYEGETRHVISVLTACTFCHSLRPTGQILLSVHPKHSPAPFFPYGIWVMSLLVLSLIPIGLFKGKYFRLQEDTAV